jgi:hypothetical protein
MEHPLTDAEIAKEKMQSYLDVLARLANLEERVSELETKEIKQ